MLVCGSMSTTEHATASVLSAMPAASASRVDCTGRFMVRLAEIPAEEVATQLVLEGWLQQEPSSALVVEMLHALEAEESAFEAEEPSEEGNPT